MRKSIITEAIIFYCILAVLIILVAQTVWTDAENTAINDFAQKQLLIAHETLTGLDIILKSICGDAHYLSNIPAVISMNDKDAIAGHFWSVYNTRSSILASITRMDSAGKIAVTVPYTEFEGADISYQPHIKKILQTHKSILSGPIKTVQRFDAIIYHKPIFIQDSVFNGTVATLISFDSLITRFFSPLFSRTGQTVWLVDGDGKVLVHSKLATGTSIDSIYDVDNVEVENFLENFPPTKDNFILYKDKNGTPRMLCHSSIILGAQRWTLGLDSPKSIALSPLRPLKRKIFAVAICSLLFALIAVILIVFQIEKKHKLEHQYNMLKIQNSHREKLDKIYRFAQSLIYPELSRNPLEKITQSISQITEIPVVFSWKFQSDTNSFIPGHYIIEDFQILDELRAEGIDPAQIELKPIIGDINITQLSRHITIPIQSLENSPYLSAVIHILRSLKSFSHITLIPLKLREKLFGCVIFPTSTQKKIDVELLETFRLSISQILYIKEILDDLYTSNRIHKDILNTIDKAVFLVDSELNILSASPMFYRIYGVSTQSVGKNLLDVVPFLKNLHREQAYFEVIKTKTSIETEETYLINEDRKVITRTKIIPIIEENSQVNRILTIVEDITSFRVLEEQLKHTADELAKKNRQLEKLAITDELTQLRNYRYFTENLPKVIHQHISENKTLTLLTMDLDNFKLYNDTYGHQAGDRLLSEMAEIVRGFLRSDDFAARYGGDEFVLVLSDCDKDEGMDTAERLCRRIARTPFPDMVGNRVEHITVSIGVAILSDDVDDAEELLRRADTALYISKARGRNQVTFYEVEIEETP